jgi:hypothetical protein
MYLLRNIEVSHSYHYYFDFNIGKYFLTKLPQSVTLARLEVKNKGIICYRGIRQVKSQINLGCNSLHKSPK